MRIQRFGRSRLGHISTDPVGGGGGSLAEPMYTAAPGQSLNVYDDFSQYPTIASMTTTERTDGGPSWQLGSSGSYLSFLGENDPYTSTKVLRIDARPTTGAFNPGFRSATSSSYLLNNPGSAAESFVIEWAVRCAGADSAEFGKDMDFNPLTSPPGRHLFNAFDAWIGNVNNCNATNLLCQAYYADGGATPLFAGIPPTAQYIVPQIWTSSPFMDPVFSQNCRYNQNRNWGTANGEWDMMTNADGDGTTDAWHNNTWKIVKVKLTREQPGGNAGEGRIEMWIGGTAGSLIKIAEYLGDDVDAPEYGIVWVGPRSSNLLFGRLSAYYLTSEGYAGDQIWDMGYLRVFTVPAWWEE